MYLRDLESKDAPLMLEWMQDEKVTAFLNADFTNKTLADAEAFIAESTQNKNSIHQAIVSDTDEYMGTVSLKYIDQESKSAEFAIAIRSAAMNHGYAWFGMKAIIERAFNELGMESVYWCVRRDNERAIRFYDKHNFHEVVDMPEYVLNRYPDGNEYKWYSMLKGDVFDDRDTAAGCKIIRIRTIPTIGSGEVSFLEGTRDIPFEIKRIYYVSKVPEGMRRGFHAHKSLKQFLFCPYGRIQLILDNGTEREEVELSDPSVGVLLDTTVWREMLWIQKDSVLCVAASDYYNEDDYIRDYREFKEYLAGL